MKRPLHPLRPIYWSFGVMIFLMTLLFGMGLFYEKALEKIQSHRAAAPSVADLDLRLSKRIGKTYDKEFHHQLIDAVNTSEEGVAHIVQASAALSKSVLRIGGASALIALLALFLLVRRAHQFPKTVPTPDAPPSSEPSPSSSQEQG